MARNRNDSGGSFSHSQMRANFTEIYRKQIGKQDTKKSAKSMKETMRKSAMRENSSTIYRDIWIIIGVVFLLILSFYYVFNVLAFELNDIIPTVSFMEKE